MTDSSPVVVPGISTPYGGSLLEAVLAGLVPELQDDDEALDDYPWCLIFDDHDDHWCDDCAERRVVSLWRHDRESNAQWRRE